jgi:1,2-diacylglycerol 3-alpha-glucosyltransferase
MNIAIFTNNYLPNPYGVSTSVDGFRQALIKKGHTVYIFAPRWDVDDGHIDQENVFRYPAVKVPTKIDFFLAVPFSQEMDHKINELHFDLVHAQHPNLLGDVAKRWAQKKDVPLVFTWHSLYDRYAHYMPFVPEKLSAHLAVKNAATFANHADHVIVPTAPIIPVIKKNGVTHDRIDAVASGVDEALFADPDGAHIRTRYNISLETIVLVTVSRLSEEKNVLFLAQQIARVLQQNDNVVFLCGGEGDQQDAMQEIFSEHNVEDKVIFTGKVEREDVKHFFAAGDIFVYASTSETQGTIVTENMYVGRPIVGVGINGVKSLIEHEVNGLATDEDDTFAKSVQRLIDHKEERELFGKNAYTIAREKYTTDKCAERLISVYKKAISYYKSK